ncbi:MULTISPECIES: DUF418 domain-containing protein [Pseudonocardia]|uniref:DUF418 domain-containing protein n=2 Tax=Pseudonocardia TaxID=1847 RepID=A0A1Y2MLT5_PSEAH|nr:MULTISPECIES: DUF418 domain-containing protein [Pseudonocardia]OSY35617.1 hypothetical protein BG845_05952 [Pseudonocardia autotrophica]TDN76908.1 putative membrane protein YeiB [Pseudonocardia autotrophica]BBG00911.1 hypothetical protein Pdca_21200 [Pseudonocardia autotrophica]GEC27530.1 hypothetical protein PSA01_45590 [Pseudonocardia saturnea]
MTTDHTHPPATAGPAGLTGRIPAPDIARGVMLLLIVLANTPYYLYGRPHGGMGAHPVDGSVVDRVVQAVLITTVDLRVYPMFAFLFGYGLVMILRRQQAAGLSDDEARRLLRRRNLLLVAFGAVHALLLWGGDVLGAYGLCGLALVWLFLRRSDRTLLVWAGIGTGLLALLAVLSALEGLAVLAGLQEPNDVGATVTVLARASVSDPDLLGAALARMTMWPIQVLLIQGLVGMVVPVSILLGFWAARHRVLDRPWEHRRLLWITAVGGITIGWLAGLPFALTHIGVLDTMAPALSSFAVPQMLAGLACGLGYVAAFGLIGDRLAGRPLGPLGGALTAVGKRSLTCYLAQSLLCAPLLAAWGLGLGGILGSAQTAAFAIGVWLLTVLYAVVAERRGAPGPAEALLRRLTYGPPTAAPTATPTAAPTDG